MTKDFKSKQNSDSPFNDVTSWILAGIALGLFIGLMIYIFSGNNTANIAQATEQTNIAANSQDANSTNHPDLSSRDIPSPENSDPVNKRSKMEELDQVVKENLSNSDNDSRPTFDYHVILPTLDVEVAVARPTEWKEKEKTRKPKTKKEETDTKKKEKVEKITKPGNYVIQVGAYKQEAEALKMKDKVGSIGVSGYVQKASVKGTTWYRVRVGPISDLNKVNQIRSQLSSKGIASFKKAVK